MNELPKPWRSSVWKLEKVLGLAGLDGIIDEEVVVTCPWRLSNQQLPQNDSKTKITL
jgi:hypothetical protein